MLQTTNNDLARFIGNLLPEAVKSSSVAAVHRGLIVFHTGILLDFVKRVSEKNTGALEEETLAWVLPAAMEPLQVAAAIEVASSRESIMSEVVVS